MKAEPQEHPATTHSTDPELPPDAFEPVSRRVATFWNMLFAYVYIGLILVRNLLLVPLYLHHLSEREYGAWVSTGGVLGYIMTDFGLLAVLLQQAAVAYGKSDRDGLSRLGGTGLIIAGALSVLTSAVGIVASPFIPRFFPSLDPLEALHLKRTLMVASVGNGSYVLAIAAIGLLRSLQRPFLSGLTRVLAELTGVLVTVSLLMWGWGLPSLAWGLVTRSVLAIGVNLTWLLYIWFRELRISMRWATADALRLIGLSTYQFITFLASGLKDVIDPFMVGVFLGPELALRYTLTIRASELVRNIVNQLSIAMLPSLSHLHGEGRPGHFRTVVLTTFRLQTLAAAIGLAGVLIFNHSFVTLWVGPERYAGTAVTALITIYGLLYLTSVLGYEVLYAMGYFWDLAKIVWLDLVIRLPIMVLLLKYFGPWGATAGLIAGQLVAWNGLLMFFVVRELKLDGRGVRDLLASNLKLTLGPVGLALLFQWLAGLDPLRMAELRATGHRLQGWGIFAVHGVVFVMLQAALAYVLAPDLVRVLRRRGRIDPADAPVDAGAA